MLGIFAMLGGKKMLTYVGVKALKFATKVVVKAVQDEDKDVVDVLKEETVRTLEKLPNIITDEAVDCEKERRNAEKK